MRSSYDYVEENPLAKKHTGYRGEALLIDEDESQIPISEIILHDRQHAENVEAIIETLLPDREYVPQLLFSTIIDIVKKPSDHVKYLLDNLYISEQARSRMIRVLSIPQLNVLPTKDFKKIISWMEKHPDEAWRWAIGLDDISLFPYPYQEREEKIVNQLWKDINLPYTDFVEKYIRSTEAIWKEIYERTPRSSKLLSVEPEVAAYMPMKAYLRIIRYPDMQELSEEDKEHGAIGLAMTFGHTWKRWLDIMKGREINAHDATFWLPHERTPGLAKFLLKHKNASIDDLDIISNAWNELEPDQKRGKISDIIGNIVGRQFTDAKIPKMALIAARCGTNEYDYYEIEKRWINTLKESDNIPDIEITSNNLRMYKLAPDDVRDIWLGCPQFVTCCQSPGDAGEACAWYGHMASDSGFYVIEDRVGKMIAMSWVWRQQNAIVFDSIETKAEKRWPIIVDMYNQLANKMIRDHNIQEVRVGGEYEEWRKPDREEIALIPLPLDYVFSGLVEDDYSDADTFQSIIAKKELSKFDFNNFTKKFAKLLQGSFIEEVYSLDSEKVGEYINEFNIPWDFESRIIEGSESVDCGTITEAATVYLIIEGQKVAGWTEWAEGSFIGDPDDYSWENDWWRNIESAVEASNDIKSLLEAINYEPTLEISEPSVVAFEIMDPKGRWGVQYIDHYYNNVVITYSTKDDAESAIEEFKEWFLHIDFSLVKAEEDVEEPDRYDADDWEEVE
jgi:hypothetical protein